MPEIREIAAELVSMVRAQQFEEAYPKLFSPDASSIEPMGNEPVSKGMDAILAKAKWWSENFEMHSCESSDPFVNGNQFSAFFTIDATDKSKGERSTMKEIALYTVEDGKIVEEKFFF